MPVCCIVQCGARKNKNQPQLSLHRFPRKESLRRRWLEAVGEENINPRHKEWYLCSLHFEDNCFNRTLDVLRLRDASVPTIFPMEVEPLPDNSNERPQEKDGRASLSVSSSVSLEGHTKNLTDSTHEVEIKEEPLENIRNNDDPLHLEDMAVKKEEEEEPLPDIKYDDLLDLPDEDITKNKDKPLPDISNEWPREKERTVSSSMDIEDSIDIPSDANNLATSIIYKGKKYNNATDLILDKATGDNNKSPKPCECDLNKAVLEFKYETRIRTLEKQLERQREIAKQRRLKIKTLGKAMSRLVEKNTKLFDLLVERTQQNEGAEYLANSDNLNGNDDSSNENDDSINESYDENE